LPQVIATRNRLLSFHADMKPDDWKAVYAESVRIMNEHIIAAFPPDQIKAATEEARKLEQRPMIVSRGVLA
jgi:hypothetical protein